MSYKTMFLAAGASLILAGTAGAAVFSDDFSTDPYAPGAERWTGDMVWENGMLGRTTTQVQIQTVSQFNLDTSGAGAFVQYDFMTTNLEGSFPTISLLGHNIIPYLTSNQTSFYFDGKPFASTEGNTTGIAPCQMHNWYTLRVDMLSDDAQTTFTISLYNTNDMSLINQIVAVDIAADRATVLQGLSFDIYPGNPPTPGMYLDNIIADVVPEPASLALLGLGFAMLAAKRS